MMKLIDSWIAYPSEKAAERKRRDLFAESKDSVWLGESVFSLPHFLNTLTNPTKPIIQRNLQKHLILYCLRNFPLRYFEKLRHHPNLAGPFLTAIRQLKRYGLSPEKLREILKETGSLKENDLLTIYERYEELKNKLDVIDAEDQYSLAIEKLRMTENEWVTTAQGGARGPFLGRCTPSGWQDPPFSAIGQLSFENFSECPPLLKKLIQSIGKTYPHLKIDFKMIESPDPKKIKNVQLFSLPSPYQETNWFLKKLENPDQFGILVGGSSTYYEPIWQKLEMIGFVQGPSPFLAWKERSEGRKLLEKASYLELKEATLSQWLETLPPSETMELSSFPDKVLSLGTLSKREWIEWLKETLDEKPTIPIPERLEGIQWLELDDGDYPNVDNLWVPGLLEGQFSSVSLPTFFQESRDRSRPEWKMICEAFLDPQTLLAKKRRTFLYQLSQANEVWLTYPRLDSIGNDLSPSPLTWDFELTQTIPSNPPLLYQTDKEDPVNALKRKLQIEEERLRDDLKTKEFHTRFEKNLLKEDHIFSPSQLEAYAACPFKYYAWRVLDIPCIKEYSPEVDPEDRGTLFHNCLEQLLTEQGELFYQARSDTKKEEELYQKLEAIVEKVFAEGKKELSYAHPELYQHLKQRTYEQGKQVLSKELKEARQLELPLKPTYFEWAFGTTPENALRLENILIGGRIDRIDIDLTKKRFLVLDYKTGQTGVLKEKLMEGLSLQLPIYLLAVRKLLLPEYQGVGGLLISVRSGDKKYGLVDSTFNETHYKLSKRSSALAKAEDFEKTIETTIQQIQNYVSKIRQGYFSAQPKDCRPYCDYKEICRYAHKPMD